MTAGAETTDFRYGDTYGGFFVPRTVLTTSRAGAGVVLILLATVFMGVGTLLGLERGVLC